MDTAGFQAQIITDSAFPARAGPLGIPGVPVIPAKSLYRTYPAVPEWPESVDLERTRRWISVSSARPTSKLGDFDVDGATVHLLSRESEISEPAQSLWHPYRNRFRLLSACFMILGNGLNDSAPGALIPSMEKYYSITYGRVALVFVGTALGFITAAFYLDSLRRRLKFAGSLALAQAALAIGYLPVVVAAPFAVVVLAFFVVGFGMGINLPLCNAFCANLRSATAILGALHGLYGVGGTAGPLIATAIVSAGGDAAWSRFYLLTLGLTLANAAFAAWSFRGYEADSAVVGGHNEDYRHRTDTAGSQLASMLRAFRSRVVVLGSLFIFAYQGAEVSISGWVLSFLLATRAEAASHASSVGFVTAGFWGGITVGRFLLSGVAHRVGERRFVFVVTGGAAVFELLVWLLPGGVIGPAVAVAIVGLLLGPVYPCAAAVFMRSLPHAEQVPGMGVIAAFGSSGGAVAPFVTGMLAQVVGTFVLHPIAIALFAVMLVCWWALPAHRGRIE